MSARLRLFLLSAVTLAGAAPGVPEQSSPAASPMPRAWPSVDPRDPFGLGTQRPTVEQLVEKLHDPNPLVRATAALWLSGRSDLQRAVPALIAALDDPNPLVRQYASHGLAAAQAREATPKLIELLEGDDIHTRRAAAEALCVLGPPAEGVPVLLRAIDREDHREGARAAMASALGRVSATPEVVQRLAALLTDPDSRVRDASQAALSGMGGAGEAALPALIAAVRQPNGIGRRHAAAVLGSLGRAGGPAVPALFGLIEDADLEVRKAAVDAIRAIRRNRPRPLS